VLGALRQTRSADRREQQGSVVEDEIDSRLLQPARLETGVVDNDAAAQEEIGQYNQCARWNGVVKDHHGDALAVGKLHGAHAVGGRRQATGLHVEGKETVTREARFERIQRDGYEPLEGGWTPKNFS
jgi:hypothetical protein